MDAKQVWRAALGELQVSLSPANFETWLRDTTLVDVDDNRFRIAVPNGFAKDWLESRYRSLISQTLARIVGYSVQVEFVVGTAPDLASDEDGPAAPPDGPLPALSHLRRAEQLLVPAVEPSRWRDRARAASGRDSRAAGQYRAAAEHPPTRSVPGAPAPKWSRRPGW